MYRAAKIFHVHAGAKCLSIKVKKDQAKNLLCTRRDKMSFDHDRKDQAKDLSCRPREKTSFDQDEKKRSG